MSGRVAWLAVSPALLMVALVGVYELRRERPVVKSSEATSIALPGLALPSLVAGSYTVVEGGVGVAVRDPLATHIDRVTTVTGAMQVDAEGRPTALTVAIDLLPLAAPGADPWQADALFALRDAAAAATARFVADRIEVRPARAPGVLALDCEGSLSLHGHVRRCSVTLFLGAERRDRARLQGQVDVDVRAFGLPRSWRYGVIPMDPSVRACVDLTWVRQGKGS